MPRPRKITEENKQKEWRQKHSETVVDSATRPHPAVVVCLSLGVPSILLGVSGVILSIYFRWAVGFTYLGMCLLLIFMLIDPGLKKYSFWRFVGGLFIVSLLALFTWGVVLPPAPLEINVDGIPGDYPRGTRSRA